MTEVKPSVDIVTLANCSVFDSEGKTTRLGLVWQKQKTVLIFLRHFACIACRAHASQIWNEREKYEKAGSQIVFVGNGKPFFIDKFRGDLKLDGATILTDPSLESFRAAGFRNGFMALVQPQSAVNAVKLFSEGHRQTSYTNDAGTHWQLGGILAISTQGKVLYHYISQALGDFPPENDFDESAELAASTAED